MTTSSTPSPSPSSTPTPALSAAEQRARDRVFLFLDERFGAGADCTLADYDSLKALRGYAIDDVGCDEELTSGCGVGPLMYHIEAWLAAFAAGERATIESEAFPLGVAFSPENLGFRLFRSRDSLLTAFPSVMKEPEGYPVFAREEARLAATSTRSRRPRRPKAT